MATACRNQADVPWTCELCWNSCIHSVADNSMTACVLIWSCAIVYILYIHVLSYPIYLTMVCQWLLIHAIFCCESSSPICVCSLSPFIPHLPAWHILWRSDTVMVMVMVMNLIYTGKAFSLMKPTLQGTQQTMQKWIEILWKHSINMQKGIQ
jgi:hypothetical protein